MENITILAKKRAVTGKAVSKLRKSGQLPAVVYGHNTEVTSLQIDSREFVKVFKKAGESTLVNLDIEGKKQPVIIHDVQNHYLTGNPVHVDFFAVNMNEKLTATVQLHFVGESPAVKTLGGVLAKNLSEIEVECLPVDLPSHIEVDISTLVNFEDMIRVKDLKVSDKVEIKAGEDEMIATVTAPRSEAEMAALDEKPVEADVTAVEGVVKPTDMPAGAADSEGDKKEGAKKE